MKVKDLIELLSKLDQEYEIEVDGEYGRVDVRVTECPVKDRVYIILTD